MARVEVIPEHYMGCEMKEPFIRWLLGLPCRAIDRKELYVEWCRENNCELRREDVERVYPRG